MLSQAHISPTTPMGANLVASGGATFRAWAPRATAVYVNGTFSGTPKAGQTDDLLMARDANGYWTGFIAEAAEGDPYHFFVVGAGSRGFKRDPYAREMASDKPFPHCSCLIRSATAYPWHDAAFVTPDFSNMIVYQLHVGTFKPRTPGMAATFLDVIGKIEYLAALGINVLQPLPVDEMETHPSMGYNGADYFSPDFPYVVTAPATLAGYLATINRLLAAKGFPPLSIADITPGPAQLKAMVDLCHLYGIAVAFDAVYNHAGGFENDDESLYFWDRAGNTSDNNQSLYFTDKGFAGGLSFALWNNDVREFIINSARYYIDEFHVDGFRDDEISALLSLNLNSGWTFCRDLTDALRAMKPRLLQNAEYWPFEFQNFPQPSSLIVTPTVNGGAGFDVLQHDGLRGAIRGAVGQASQGESANVDFNSIAANLYPQGFRARMASGHLRRKSRSRSQRPRDAPAVSGRWIERPLLVRSQPLALCYWTAAHRARNPAAFHGTGISGRQTMGFRSEVAGKSDLVGRRRCGPRPRHGESPALHAGPHPPPLESAGSTRRQCERLPRTQSEPRDCLSSLAGRLGTRRNRRSDAR